MEDPSRKSDSLIIHAPGKKVEHTLDRERASCELGSNRSSRFNPFKTFGTIGTCETIGTNKHSIGTDLLIAIEEACSSIRFRQYGV
jgi:hypothetical protein